MYVYSPPPTNLLPTAEKAREILREAQETFKKQRETIKLEAEVCMYICTYTSVVLVKYSETLFNGHPSTADTHDITILKVQTVLLFTSILQQPLNSGHPATLYNGQFSQSQLFTNNTY